MLKRLKIGRLLGLLLFTHCAYAQSVSLHITGIDGAAVPFAVVLLPDLPASSEQAPTETLIDQRDKRFVPHVIVVRPGASVRFPNSDNTRHSVYSFSKGNSFEIQLYRSNDAPPVTFSQPGIVKLGCNIHDSMKAYVYVTDNTSAVVTDDQGLATMAVSGIEAGEVLEVWHPQLSSPMKIAVTAQMLPAGGALELKLPIAWVEPQTGKSAANLESLLKRYAGDEKD